MSTQTKCFFFSAFLQSNWQFSFFWTERNGESACLHLNFQIMQLLTCTVAHMYVQSRHAFLYFKILWEKIMQVTFALRVQQKRFITAPFMPCILMIYYWIFGYIQVAIINYSTYEPFFKCRSHFKFLSSLSSSSQQREKKSWKMLPGDFFRSDCIPSWRIAHVDNSIFLDMTWEKYAIRNVMCYRHSFYCYYILSRILFFMADCSHFYCSYYSSWSKFLKRKKWWQGSHQTFCNEHIWQ